MEPFNIYIHRKQKEYAFKVSLYHDSAQVQRFLLQIKGNEMRLEKRLNLHRQPWRLLSATFEFKAADAGVTLRTIFKEIEYKMKPTPGVG